MNLTKFVAMVLAFSACCSVVRGQGQACWVTYEAYCDDEMPAGCDGGSCMDDLEGCGTDGSTNGDIWYGVDFVRDDDWEGEGGQYYDGTGYMVYCGATSSCTCHLTGQDPDGNNEFSCSPGQEVPLTRFSSELGATCPTVEP